MHYLNSFSKVIRNLVCFGVVLLLPMAIYAQDLQTELQRAKTLLLESTSIHLETSVRVSVKNDEEFPFNNLKTVIKTDAKSYLYENNKITILINEQWILMAFHDEKIIMYAHNSSKELEKARKKALSKDLGMNLAVNDKITYNGTSAGISHYSIQNSVGPVAKAEMYFDSNTGFLSKLVYHYAAANEMGIVSSVTEISLFKANPSFSNDEFSESRFLKINGKDITPSDRYKDYQLSLTDPEFLKSL